MMKRIFCLLAILSFLLGGMKRIFCLLAILSFLLGGCVNDKENISEVEISISEAETIAYESINKNDEERLFMCETIKIIENNIYYFIRGFYNDENKVTTFGWYLVNVNTGEIFDAGSSQNELIPIK